MTERLTDRLTGRVADRSTDHLNDLPTQLRLDEAPDPAKDRLAPDPLIVRLHKSSSWEQGASRWPYYLSRAEPGKTYSKAQIMNEVFQDDRSHQKRPEYGWLRSLYGIRLEREYQEVTIEGIGLFERLPLSTDEYMISEDGLALARAYSTDPTSQNWKHVFAGIIARNDVRVRAVLLHLARWSAYLTFPSVSSDGFFARGGALRLSSGNDLQLFEYAPDKAPAYSFNLALDNNQQAILGPFLTRNIERVGLRVPEHVIFEGGRDSVRGVFKEPSGNQLRLYMRQALALFRDIGALVYVEHRRGWTLDQERCAALFAPELVADLFAGKATDGFLDALRVAYKKLSDSDGFVRVTDIREYVGDELDIAPGERADYFNQQVAHYMRPDIGKLGLGHLFHAQAAPDECLFGNLEMEYVEFTFTE